MGLHIFIKMGSFTVI